MTASQRRRLFALAPAATLAVLAWVALAAGGREDELRRAPARPAAARVAPTVLAPSERPRSARRRETPEQNGEDLPTGARPRRASIAAMAPPRRVARRFLAALLRFEIEGADPQLRGAIRGSAAPGLARLLLADDPRRPAGLATPARGSLVALDALPARRAVRLEFFATIERGGRASGLIVALRRREGRWWVAAIR